MKRDSSKTSELTYLSDKEVIDRVLTGEKNLYETLIRRKNQTLFRVLRTYLKEEEEVQDIMQNTYLKAFEKLHQFRLETSFSTWLIQIGINEALQRLRQKGKIQTDIIDPFHHDNHDPHDHSNPENDISSSGIPFTEINTSEHVLDRKDAKKRIEKAIDNLDPKYKTIFLMKEIEEMSMAEISDSLAISSSNAKVRLHRAKRMIREELMKHPGKQDVFGFAGDSCDQMVENVLYLIE